MAETNVDDQAIFEVARKIDSREARRAYLQKMCGEDQPLRQRIAALLFAYDENASFLESPPPELGTSPTLDQTPREQPGALIGPYKLLEQIGEGGMGLVYMAEQQRPLRRLVALKLIKPGMDSRQVIARFEAEKQALAMMDHPNIARIFDAGTTGEKDEGGRMKDENRTSGDSGSSLIPHPSSFATTGRLYFAMELVRGIPINEFCDQKRLTVRERLELFIQVCQAVQHAHQKGIIHRDLKPTNVLVTMHDAVAVPKVIDFGIAKALHGTLARSASEGFTLHTGFAQLVGTPLYMSPEQAEMNQLGVDTRSDVYSLGVLLYELLTGTTPFDKERLKSAGFDEMRRIIREEEPETVSARLARTRTNQPRVDAGVNRRVHAALSELDWIVMKALEKDRSRRYESASALATDIQRYLSDEPVLACPPTTMYRFQKFARKHKPALATAAVIAASLILGTTVSAWQAARATQAEAQANANEAQAKEAAAAEAQQRQRAEANEQKANTQRDEAQRQRDEVKTLADELRTTLYASNMNRAKTAWDQNSVNTVVNLLNDHRPKAGETDLRGFEWHFLHRLCNPAPPLVLNLRQYGVLSVTYSPDGKRLVSSTWGSWNSRTLNYPELQMWDAETGKELFKLKGSDFQAVAFSPDGKRIASATTTAWDDTNNKFVTSEARVWDSQTGAELLALKGHTGHVVTLAYSSDGKLLASGSKGEQGKVGELKLWDAATGQEVRSMAGNIESVVFSPDGKRLAYALGAEAIDGQPAPTAVKIIDAETGRELLQLPGGAKKWLIVPTAS